MAEYKDITKLKMAISDIKGELWENSFQNRSYITGYVSALSYVERRIESLPIADVVAVVRCKDCKSFVENQASGVTYCNRELKRITADDFCSSGRRKDV